jgi:SAM-dependent methyltransferase
VSPDVDFSTVAETYERLLVPAMFAPLARAVADAVDVGAGDRVLDVACGTGALTRVLAARAGASGEVVGADVAEGMLAVARSLDDRIRYVQAPADELPFEDGRFTAVTCQQGLQFTQDPVAALREMARVLAGGGRIAVACWCDLEHDAGFHALAESASEHLGEEAGRMLRVPFRISDPATLRGHFESAGMSDVVVEIERIAARVAAPPERFAEAVMTAGPAAAVYGEAPDAAREAFAADVALRLARYGDGGATVFEMPSLLAVARV